MKTPRNGRKITRMNQPVFPHPEMSCRRKRSPKIRNSSVNQITQAKKMSIVQRMSRNG